MNTPAGADDPVILRRPHKPKAPKIPEPRSNRPIPPLRNPQYQSCLPQTISASVTVDQHGKSGPTVTSVNPSPFVRSTAGHGAQHSIGAGGHYYPESTATTDSRGWDVFRTLPPPPDSLKQSLWVDIALQILKIVTFFVVCCLLLGSAVIAKGTFLLMTSAIGLGGKNTSICANPRVFGSNVNSTVIIEHKHIVKWVWSLYIALCIPEVLCFIRCFHRVVFRNVKKPRVGQFFLVFVMETFHAIGVGMLVFKVLPGLDAITGAMLTNCFCFVPAVLTLLSRKGEYPKAHDAWAVPAALCFISAAWWPNFVHTDSVFPFIRKLARIASALNEKRSKTYVIVSLWKCLIYFCTLFAFISMRMNVDELLEADPFGHKPIKVVVWRPRGGIAPELPNYEDMLPADDKFNVYDEEILPAKATTPQFGPVVIDTRDFIQGMIHDTKLNFITYLCVPFPHYFIHDLVITEIQSIDESLTNISTDNEPFVRSSKMREKKSKFQHVCKKCERFR